VGRRLLTPGYQYSALQAHESLPGFKVWPHTVAARARESQGQFKAEAFLYMSSSAASVAHESHLGYGYDTLFAAAATLQDMVTGGPTAEQRRRPTWLTDCARWLKPVLQTRHSTTFSLFLERQINRQIRPMSPAGSVDVKVM